MSSLPQGVRLPEGVLEAKLWCERERKRYYSCYLFRSRQDMMTFHNHHHRAIGLKWQRQTFEAIASQWTYVGGDRVSQVGTLGKVGHVLFHQGNLGAGIVSHEMTHAAWFMMLRYHPRLVQSCSSVMDERMAWVQGWLVTQFWRKFWRWRDQGKLDAVRIRGYN